MEMLIVIAMIAVLIIIAISVFASQLEKAREAGEEDNQTAIFYLKKEKEKKKKEVEMEIEFPKTDIRQAVPKEENCCYTKLSEKKKPISLKEKLLGNRFIGGR